SPLRLHSPSQRITQSSSPSPLVGCLNQNGANGNSSHSAPLPSLGPVNGFISNLKPTSPSFPSTAAAPSISMRPEIKTTSSSIAAKKTPSSSSQNHTYVRKA